MGKGVFLGFLWVSFLVQLACAQYVSDCLDGQICTKVRVIAQKEPDVRAALQNHVSAQLVDLHGNLIERFPTRILDSMYNLKTLNLSYNLLTDIQLPNARNQQLQTIDLTYNNLERIDVPVSVLTFVAVRNKLHTASFPSNNLLKTLILSMNKFDSLRGFENLKQVIKLDLSCNQIRQVDLNVLSAMSQLRNLNLANNHIHSVSGSRSVHSLQTLDLSNNILTMVDESFNGFPAVTQLNLQNNKIVMWVHNITNMRQLQNLDITQNDWDCKNLEETLNKRSNIKINGESSCSQDHKSNICCTTSGSPYADRLIKYRQQEFGALKTGTKQLQGEINCQDYTPNPCDGDDNRVYEVANSALYNAETIAQASVAKLQASLQHEKNTLDTLKRQHETYKQETAKIENTQRDLAQFIESKYREAQLFGATDEVAQLDALFARYNTEINDLKTEINKQDRENQDKLTEINQVNNEMDELNSRKDSLMEEVNRRNGTVIEYKRRIAELEQKIRARDQRT